ncbi:zinc dependent phospholipase C family protein [Calditerrivibrio sp.]|uniref:zinc dependent phospholipase C family protein n=1 Tax=Calditerrivibrio sp. TaxID=2792612 RepID=UPI003D10DF3C
MWIISVFFIFLPINLFAWGPETHIKIAFEILNTTNFSLIKSYQAFFLAGNIFPDLFNLFKDISRFKKSLPTHSWNTVSRIFDAATLDSERAFAYGYSAHLAADIIAHNQFVPQQTLLVSKSRFLSHFMLELATATNDKRFRYTLIELLEKANIYGNIFLKTFNIDEKFFKKEIFLIKNGIRLQNFAKIPEIVNLIKTSNDSTFHIKSSIYEEKSIEMAKKTIDSGFSDLIKYDPSGKNSIAKARNMRKELIASFGKKKLKKHHKENISLTNFNPDKIK